MSLTIKTKFATFIFLLFDQKNPKMPDKFTYLVSDYIPVMKNLLLYLFVLMVVLPSCKKTEADYGDSPDDIKKTMQKLMAHSWLMDSITKYTPSNERIVTLIPEGPATLVFTESTFTETADTSGQMTANTFSYELKAFNAMYYWPPLSYKNEDIISNFNLWDNLHLSVTNLNVGISNQPVVTKYYTAE